LKKILKKGAFKRRGRLIEALRSVIRKKSTLWGDFGLQGDYRNSVKIA